MNLPPLLRGNSPAELITAASIAAGTLLLVWIVRALARRKLSNAHLTPTGVDDFFAEVVHRTKIWLLALPCLHLGVRALTLPHELLDPLRTAAMFALIVQATLWATGAVDFWLKRYQRQRLASDPQAVTTLGAFRVGIVGAIWVVAAIFAIEKLTGSNVSTLVTGLGIGGVAIALATQNILGDLFASLSIVIDKPFVIGDFIVVGETAGTVEHIGLKTTRLRSVGGEQLIVGNGDLLKSRIGNFRRMYERRVLFKFGIVYDTPAEKLARVPVIVREAVERHEKVRFDRSHLLAFGETGLEFESVYWVLTPEFGTYADVHHAVSLEIIRAFEAEGIGFAYRAGTTSGAMSS